MEGRDDHETNRIKHAALTALSAAAVKAKLLANQEEDEIRELVSLLIEKQVNSYRLVKKSGIVEKVICVIQWVYYLLNSRLSILACYYLYICCHKA